MNAPDAATPAAAPAPLDRPIRELIEHERVVALYRMAPAAIVAGLVYCPFFAWALTYREALPIAWVWLAVRLTLGVLRLWDIARFVRAAPGPDRSGRWRKRGLAMLALDAGGWATIAPVFLNHGVGLEQALVLTTVFSVAAIGTMTLAVNLGAVTIFAVGMLAPAVIVLLLRADTAGFAGAAGGVIFVVVLLYEARRAERAWAELQRLRFENARIAHDAHRLRLLAEHASAAKSRFLAAMSHELRTPLNGIMGTTQLLLSEPPGDATRERLHTIAGSAQHLRQLIGDLVDLSRVEAGKLDLDVQPFEPAALVNDTVQLLQPAARDKGLALHVELSPALPPRLLGDGVRLKQVLHNLLGNAIKFTDHGAVFLSASWQAPVLRIVVRDTGPGIPTDSRSAIFDAFEQGPQRRGSTGLGLGLTIARELARAMGGDVVLQADSGPGAAFVFTLRSELASPADAAALERSLALPRFDAHALLVEDNAVNAEVARAMLEHLGLRVSVADDGVRALALQSTGAFDVVLMDCEMPVLDGLATTRRWRDVEALAPGAPHVPIVALTANAVQGDRERCLAAGMDDYIAKPFELAELAAVLYRVLPPR